MFKKILIANRGEIAVRIIRTCKLLDIKTVAIYSEKDKNSMHKYLADEAICIGYAKTEDTYLNIKKIINAAKISKSDAIHPGYGFLSENYKFVKEIEQNNIKFIGPNSELIKILGNKINAINLAKKYEFNTLPNYILTNNIKLNKTLAKKLGYPIIIKSLIGGGGKGIKITTNEQQLEENIKLTKKEAQLSFNNNEIYIEKYLQNARHIEIQSISDNTGTIIIGERECSIQEKQQKIIEETPIKNINKTLIKKINKQCKNLYTNIKYQNISTTEFLYENNILYFLEINPRIQVEHTITENTTNIDLIKTQIDIAYKKTHNIKKYKRIGHSIQCRINIENSKNSKIKFMHIPSGNGIRFDSHIYNGYKIPIFYDKLIAKLITYGKNKNEAKKKMLIALNELILYNINTNVQKLIKILNSNAFDKNKITTHNLKNINKSNI